VKQWFLSLWLAVGCVDDPADGTVDAGLPSEQDAQADAFLFNCPGAMPPDGFCESYYGLPAWSGRDLGGSCGDSWIIDRLRDVLDARRLRTTFDCGPQCDVQSAQDDLGCQWLLTTFILEDWNLKARVRAEVRCVGQSPCERSFEIVFSKDSP
jgi:hypothetical protein